ncbi:IclR family transcriptional regulator [Streptomyces sp. CMB-StM0423]|uniref:IclR family transcriptional regulator n=1 Tax=Streptomyces sp. CMB-StM0423 TaxID=2059884 RepID=UPI000C7092B6|nr:IclR family transcriptional regulator [Streptomyces sp. CMB-StM0423]AUH39341.1 IclR family transcriptional regulator [Streptomyces sp. CMB-StM0423]
MPGPVQSVERAAAILHLLARGSGRLGVSELSGSLGLAKGTVHGLLRTLQQVGFVEQDRDTGKYRIGDTLRDLRSGHVDANELRSRALNWADGLAARSREAVRIGVPADGRVLVVHHVFRPGDPQQTLDVATTLPAHATALGKVLLAYDVNTPAVLGGEPPAAYTPRTLTAPAVLLAELRRVREAGWAGEHGERRLEEAGIAAPLRGPGGLVVGALGISGPAERLCERSGTLREDLVGLVLGTARSVSRDLGASRR